MARLGKQMRKYSKAQFGKLMADNLVSDRETQEFEDQAREGAQAGLQAQTALLNRAASANKAGSPVVAGTLKDASAKLAAKAADIGVKASGQAQQFTQALKQQRAAQTLNLASQQRAINREDFGMALDAGTAASSMLAEMFT